MWETEIISPWPFPSSWMSFQQSSKMMNEQNLPTTKLLLLFRSLLFLRLFVCSSPITNIHFIIYFSNYLSLIICIVLLLFILFSLHCLFNNFFSYFPLIILCFSFYCKSTYVRIILFYYLLFFFLTQTRLIL